jgi:hypothetical protein
MDASLSMLYQGRPGNEQHGKRQRMNITMNIDCTPEEARRFMGLPDMAPIHDLYLDKMKEAMTNGITPDMLENITRSWGGMGEMGMNAWRQMVDQMTGTATPKS